MPKRKKDPWTLNPCFDKQLTGFLRYEIFEGEFEKRYRVWCKGARLVDVACELRVEEEDVWRAIETSTHRDKGKRYWWEKHREDTWVGANYWPANGGEASLWPPLGGQYFRCPNGWTRKEGEGLVDYIERWFVWERGCPSAEVVEEWRKTADIVENFANRRRTVTFHAGPR